MQRDSRRVLFAFRPIELAAYEGRRMRRIQDARGRIAPGNAPELDHEVLAPLPNQLRELGGMVGEEMKLARGPELLPLKEHRRLWRQQQQRRQDPGAAGTRLLVQPPTVGAVRDLIM